MVCIFNGTAGSNPARAGGGAFFKTTLGAPDTDRRTHPRVCVLSVRPSVALPWRTCPDLSASCPCLSVHRSDPQRRYTRSPSSTMSRRSKSTFLARRNALERLSGSPAADTPCISHAVCQAAVSTLADPPSWVPAMIRLAGAVWASGAASPASLAARVGFSLSTSLKGFPYEPSPYQADGSAGSRIGRIILRR